MFKNIHKKMLNSRRGFVSIQELLKRIKYIYVYKCKMEFNLKYFNDLPHKVKKLINN